MWVLKLLWSLEALIFLFFCSVYRIFVNRSLHLENIKFYGFDMDYTLAGECFATVFNSDALVHYMNYRDSSVVCVNYKDY